MSDNNGESKAGPTDLQVLKGGQDIDVKYLDGSSEKITIKIPSIRKLDLWESLQADEASLVELYCGKLDHEALYATRRLFRERASLNELRAEAKTLEDRQKVDAEISKIDKQLEVLDQKERWDDKLTPESHDEIYKIGDQLTRPRYDRWEKNIRAATDRTREKLERLLSKPKKETAASASGSASSSPTAASP